MVHNNKNRTQATSSCCGSNLKRSKPAVAPIPTNPKVQRGKAVIYLGTGAFRIKGAESGNIYHASDHQRHFSVEAADLPSVLRNPNIILKP